MRSFECPVPEYSVLIKLVLFFSANASPDRTRTEALSAGLSALGRRTASFTAHTDQRLPVSTYKFPFFVQAATGRRLVFRYVRRKSKPVKPKAK